MPKNEIKIRISMDTAAGERNLKRFEATSNNTFANVAVNTRKASQAFAAQTRALELDARATLNQAAATEVNTRAALAGTRQSEALLRIQLSEARQRNLSTRLVEEQSRAVKEKTQADRGEEAETKRVAANIAALDRQRKASVAALERQHRDETAAIRQEIAAEKDLARSAEQAARAKEQAHAKGETGMSRLASAASNFGQAATFGVTVPILVGAGEAINLAANLEQSLNQVQVQSKATDVQMAQVAQTARDLGGDMTLPATSSVDAAQAMLTLTQKSLSLNDAMAAARGTLQLSAAATNTITGETLSAAQAAEIEGDALKAFKLRGTEATRVADLFAASQAASGTAVNDVALALQQSGAVFQSNAQTIDTATTAINLMGKAGIRGSDAGTSLKTMLIALTPHTKQAKEAMKDLGVNTYDANGRMLPLRDIIAQVSEATSKLSDKQRQTALMTIFGTDAIRAANVVLASGVGNYDAMYTATTRQGAAADLAAAKNKGLKGAIDGLGSELQTFAEKEATPFLHSLTNIVRETSDLIDTLDHLPKPVKDGGLALLAVAAVAGPTAIGIGQVVSMVVQVRSGLALLAAAKGGATLSEIAAGSTAVGTAETAAGAAGAVAFATGGAWFVAITGAVALVTGLVYQWAELSKEQDQAKDSAKGYADTLKTLAQGGERGALIANNNKIKTEIADLDTALREAKAGQGIGFTTEYRMRNNLAFNGYDADNPNYSSVSGVENRIAALKASQAKIDARLGEMRTEGAGAVNRAVISTGADGFAKSVVSHAFDDINTPKNLASCAFFVSEVFKRAGAKIPDGGIGGAKAMMDWAIKSGAQSHNAKDALPGDLIVFHGKGYGKNGSGYHVGIGLGNGQMIDSSGDGPGHIKSAHPIVDFAHATAYTIPGSTFSNAPASSSSTGTGAGAPDDDADADKAAKDKAAAMVEAASGKVTDAQAAYDHCKSEYERTKNPYYLILAKTARQKLARAQMDEAQANLDKANQEAKLNKTTDLTAGQTFTNRSKEIGRSETDDLQSLSDQINGTPAEQQKRANGYIIAQKKAAITQIETSIENYKDAMGKGLIKDYKPLGKAIGNRRDQEIILANTEYDIKSKEHPEDAKLLDLERGQAIRDANDKAAKSINDLEVSHNALLTQGLEKEKSKLEVKRQALDIALQDAKTDTDKLAVQRAIRDNAIDQLDKQQKIDALSTDPNTRAMANDNHTIGVQSVQAAYSHTYDDTQNAARERRIQFLRSELQVSTDLTEQYNLLQEAHAHEQQAARATGDPDQIKAAIENAKRDNDNWDIANQQKKASDLLGRKILGDKNLSGQGIASEFEKLTTMGTIDQQKQAVQQYMDVLSTLFHTHAVNRKEALADITRLQEELKKTGTLTDPQIAKIIVEANLDLKQSELRPEIQQFLDILAQGAAGASANFLHNLLHPQKGTNALKQLGQDLAGTLENAVEGSLAHGVEASLQKAVSGIDGKKMFSGIESLFKGAKANLLEGAAGIYGAAMMLGAGGKKKQKHSIFGAIAGGIVGSFFGGVGAFKGAEVGSAFGGMFKDGGAPPVGIPSLVGERGIEGWSSGGKMSFIGADGPQLFTPSTPGRVISHEQLLQMVAAPSVRAPLPSAPRTSGEAGTHRQSAAASSNSPSVIDALLDAISNIEPGDAILNNYGPVHKDADLERSTKALGKHMQRRRRM